MGDGAGQHSCDESITPIGRSPNALLLWEKGSGIDLPGPSSPRHSKHKVGCWCWWGPPVPSESTMHTTPAFLLTSWLFLKYPKHTITSGPLRKLCPLPGMLFPQRSNSPSSLYPLSSFISLARLGCHLTNLLSSLVLHSVSLPQ